MFRAIRAWLAAADLDSVKRYEEVKMEGAKSVAARYSRGNVSVQGGRFMTEAGLASLRQRGREAIRFLNKAIHA